MTEKISRRDFLKLAGLGSAATAVLAGCGPASRYVTREPYTKMPEYTYNGQSTYYATTCRECAAGCGLVVRTHQGRAIKTEGNKNHPVNSGKTCSRGQATLQGLYNPDRVQNPHKQGAEMDWDAATLVVADALKNNAPGEIAFLLGMAPDHLFDLVTDLCKAMGAPAPIRYGALGMFESRATLAQASKDIFGQESDLFFDLSNADLTFSFGANFLETWLSPVAFARAYSKMRQGRRGNLVHFEARMSQTAAKADEWIPVVPGTEGLVAAALGKLVAEKKYGVAPSALATVDIETAATLSGVSLETLERLAAAFAQAEHPLALPGGAPLAHTHGLETAKAILALNAVAENLGKTGGVFSGPASPLGDGYHAPASAKAMSEFIQKMNGGKIKALFIHGVNPVFELPKALGFETALKNVPTVISFATFPDETATLAQYVFPDHHGLESWGYQRIATGASQATLSGAQPAVAPFYNTRATADVLLAAAALMGGDAFSRLPFKDEVEFIQSKVAAMVGASDGFFGAVDINDFWVQFQQYGGWWQNGQSLGVPTANLSKEIKVGVPQFENDGEFILFPFVSPVMAEAGANKPWLQETPDPTTTVMWNTWVEINPHTAEELGLHDDDVVEIVSPFGKIEAAVYLYPAIHPGVVAIPFGQGHTAYGRYAENRGANPADLFGVAFNAAGDLAYAAIKVNIEKTKKTQHLSRLESKMGVYGMEEH